MSCSRRNLSNLNTTVYSTASPCCCDNNNVTVRFADGFPNFFPPVFPMPPVNPNPPMPPMPPTPPIIPAPVTASYALFYNASATPVSVTQGNNVPFPLTAYNTDAAGITPNATGEIFTLSGGTTGRTYLVNWQVAGTFSTSQVALVVNGSTVNPTTTALNDAGIANGSYIVAVPANSVSTVSVNLVAGSVTTGTPTVGTNISFIRLA